MVGYLLAGIIVGPNTPGFIANREVAEQFAEIGIVLLMFGVGLHFDLKDLLALRRFALPGALGQSAVATALGAAAAILLGGANGWPGSIVPADDPRYRAVSVGYGPVGRTLARLLAENGITCTIIEMNLETVHRRKDSAPISSAILVRGDGGMPVGALPRYRRTRYSGALPAPRPSSQIFTVANPATNPPTCAA
jgi:hypothetical protein